CINHQAQQRYFPSGGWGYGWAGDPSRGLGKEQPGSWLFSTLSFIEESNIQQLGNALDAAEKRSGIARANQVVVPFFYCPSRRTPQTRPTTFTPVNSGPIGRIVRTDYAANGGDMGDGRATPYEGPPTTALLPTYPWGGTDNLYSKLTGVM